MEAVTFERNGESDVLEFRTVPEPEPARDEVIVRVDAVGVNYRDVYERRGGGYGSPPPAIIGVEGAGTVEETGERVAWMDVPGSYAARVAAPRARLVAVPEAVDIETAAATLMQGITAHYLANDSYPINEGDWVVVHAAAGGVGLLLTQLAKRRGGRVIATASPEKHELARSAGADEVIAYHGFADTVSEITGGEGAAAVYDGIGKSTFAAGLSALRPTGRMILYGAASGQPAKLAPTELLRSVYLQRPTILSYVATPEELRRRAAELFELIERGHLSVRIGQRYPLRDAKKAHDDLEERRTTGKIILRPTVR